VGIVIETGYWPASKWKSGRKILMEAVCPNVMVDELEPSMRWISHARYDDKSDESLMRLLAYRKLTVPAEMKDEVKSKLEELANEFDGRAYEQNFGEIVDSILYQDSEMCCTAKKQKDEHEQENRLQSVFCSELVAAMFIKCGLMDRGQFANNFMPHDFSTANNAKVSNHLVPGVTLSDEIEVVGHSTDEEWTAEDLMKGKATVRLSAAPRTCGVPSRGCCAAPAMEYVDEEGNPVQEFPSVPKSNFSDDEKDLSIEGFRLKDPVTTVDTTPHKVVKTDGRVCANCLNFFKGFFP
jgi:hypothetical protein